jgi:Peptidase M50B-like
MNTTRLPKTNQNYGGTELISLALALALVVVAWQFPIITPLKILVVFLHEASHALMTILTGGSVLTMQVDALQGGHVDSLGGIPFLIYSAGYLGSLGWGLLLLWLAVKSTADRWIMGALGVLMALLTLAYVRNGFGFLFGLSCAAGMLLLARFANAQVNDFLLKVIGLTSMIYAPLDIFSDTLVRSHLQSDAFLLAQAYGGSTWFWGGIWLIVSVTTIVLAARLLWRSRPQKIVVTTTKTPA